MGFASPKLARLTTSVAPDPLLPTGALAETFTRQGNTLGNVGGLSSGNMRLTSIVLPAGLTLTSISYMSATTALSAGTAQYFALYNSSLALLRQTVDDTSTAWASNTVKTLNLTTTFTTTYSGLHYLGIVVVASTPPSLAAISGYATGNALAPAVNGTSTTGLTDGVAPNPAAAITSQTQYPWAYVS